MWKGINVSNTGSISLNYCQIEDAQYALETNDYVGGPLSNISLLNNVFNRNYVGIIPRLPHIVGASQKLLLFSLFLGNEFKCDAQLNNPYSGQTPLPSSVSFAGI